MEQALGGGGGAKGKWARETFIGFSFQFGGKLVSFSNTRGGDVAKVVTISQVVTEQDLLHRSEQLEQSLSQQLFSDFCEQKSQQSPNEKESTLWNFLKVRERGGKGMFMGTCILEGNTVRTVQGNIVREWCRDWGNIAREYCREWGNTVGTGGCGKF